MTIRCCSFSNRLISSRSLKFNFIPEPLRNPQQAFVHPHENAKGSLGMPTGNWPWRKCANRLGGPICCCIGGSMSCICQAERLIQCLVRFISWVEQFAFGLFVPDSCVSVEWQSRDQWPARLRQHEMALNSKEPCSQREPPERNETSRRGGVASSALNIFMRNKHRFVTLLENTTTNGMRLRTSFSATCATCWLDPKLGQYVYEVNK